MDGVVLPGEEAGPAGSAGGGCGVVVVEGGPGLLKPPAPYELRLPEPLELGGLLRDRISLLVGENDEDIRPLWRAGRG